MADKQKIYLLSGLGADKRVFDRLSLPSELIHINWLTPYPDETLQQYSRRLIEANTIESNQILLGVSFGGIVAIEVSKLIQVRQVIIISSVPQSRQMPVTFRLAGYLHLYKFLPYSLLKRPNFLLHFAFSPISGEDYLLLKKIIADTEVSFLKWAIKQIVLWRSNSTVNNLIHLHGTRDKIFPLRKDSSTVVIINGGHFMIYNRAAEISGIIKENLEKNNY